MIDNNTYIETHYGTNFIDLGTADKVTYDNIAMVADYAQIVWDQLPARYRPYVDDLTIKRRKLFDYLMTVAKQMLNMNIGLNNQRAAKFQRKNWSGQTLKFQQMLRDVFETGEIYVTNTQSQVQQQYLFNRTETVTTDNNIHLYNNTETPVYETYIYNKEEHVSPFDVVITCPVAIIDQDFEIKKFVESYLLDSFNYKIEYV